MYVQVKYANMVALQHSVLQSTVTWYNAIDNCKKTWDIAISPAIVLCYNVIVTMNILLSLNMPVAFQTEEAIVKLHHPLWYHYEDLLSVSPRAMARPFLAETQFLFRIVKR